MKTFIDHLIDKRRRLDFVNPVGCQYILFKPEPFMKTFIDHLIDKRHRLDFVNPVGFQYILFKPEPFMKTLIDPLIDKRRRLDSLNLRFLLVVNTFYFYVRARAY